MLFLVKFVMKHMLVGSIQSAGGRKYNLPGVVVAVVLTTVTALNLVVCLCFWRRRRRRRGPTAQAKQPCIYVILQQFLFALFTALNLEELTAQIPRTPSKQRTRKWWTP